jgi:hypothetical protein
MGRREEQGETKGRESKSGERGQGVRGREKLWKISHTRARSNGSRNREGGIRRSFA